jgi:hypothetical protein
MGSRSDTLKNESIRPTFRGVCLNRFLHLVEGIEGLAAPRQRDAVERELEWARARTKDNLDIIDRLLDIAATSEKQRQKDLRHSHANGKRAKRLEGTSAWKEDSQSPLFRRKRAEALADILSARLVFQRGGLAANPVEAIRRMLGTDEGRKALRIALHANKKTKIGCNLMDIIVCGAIPPYNELLAGKLVAMLMASPQVVHDYAARYSGQPSEIASRLAGKAITRPAQLVVLGTTSLYHVGSSQYERIRIPGPRSGQIAYQFLGYTEGYGSAALSSETTDLLRELTIQSQGMRRVTISSARE